MNINLIGVPMFYGSDIIGVEEAPSKLRENGIIDILKTNHIVYDLGDVFIKKCSIENKYKGNKKAKYLNEIKNACNNLAHSVYLSLKNNEFPIVIGGDHSLSLGSISGSSKYFKDDLAIIWIDAHGDFNSINTSPSGNIHGMPLAALAGIGLKELKNIYFDGLKVKSDNIFILSVRDLDEGEKKLLTENKVNLWTTNDIREIGIEKVVSDIFNKISSKNINNIHLSFDIDCMDASFVPGTGTKVEKGLNPEEVKKILGYIFKFNKIKALDFVEFNPKFDLNNITLNNCLDILKLISYELR
ncbi:arginase [Clostridium perfringens]|uniref:arginase n=1 Tax=Clostridium perfringens TaxID=1502 RepID=UPI0022470857|nr:arginase [Clostridium perfringens]MCX0371848.1 arginase [Clostridium perfringens]